VDPALIRRAQTGDAEAFTALVAGRIEPMQRTAMAILGHEADARDAVAETLASVWREIPRLRDAAAFEAWSTRILVHACRRRLRGVGRARVRELRIDGPLPPAESALPTEPGVAEAVVERIGLERAFDRLGADERTILVLHHLDGRGVGEIAAVLGIPVGTAKSRLFAARGALARALERER
jgi:RNA polymerase sigma-70 factor (ECF subfamily)